MESRLSFCLSVPLAPPRNILPRPRPRPLVDLDLPLTDLHLPLPGRTGESPAVDEDD